MHETDYAQTPALVGTQYLYVTGEDNIRLTARNSAAGVTVRMAGRYVTLAGEVLPFEDLLAPGANLLPSNLNRRLGEGWLAGVVVSVSAGAPLVGQTYVQLTVIRGEGATGIVVASLLQGYVTATQDLAWPGSPIQSSIAGPGRLRVVTQANPSVGANWTIDVPDDVRWRLLTVSAQLVTDATAANREAQLSITNGSTTMALVPAGVTQVASETRRYTWFHAAPRGAGSVVAAIIGPLPMLLVSEGGTIGTTTANLQAADQWSSINATVEEWIEA